MLCWSPAARPAPTEVSNALQAPAWSSLQHVPVHVPICNKKDIGTQFWGTLQ